MGSALYCTRTGHAVKYQYLIDFGLSRKYNATKDSPRMNLFWGGDSSQFIRALRFVLRLDRYLLSRERHQD
ncbi:hypothetical protein BC628DRAFT_1384606 [Trametes gibbosa]|nr:hypothetical protein BC628DRAFT_1384606 [Trametes gibbosa]